MTVSQCGVICDQRVHFNGKQCTCVFHSTFLASDCGPCVSCNYIAITLDGAECLQNLQAPLELNKLVNKYLDAKCKKFVFEP